MADGIYYNDLKEPHMVASQAAVTLATTDKALAPAAAMPVLGSRYFDRVGKRIRIRMFGQITTGITPGNGLFEVRWGSGADATGTVLAASLAAVLVASQTNSSWMLEIEVECRATGASGSLIVTGFALFHEAAQVAHQLIPAQAPAAVTVDLTAANIPSIQYQRSGSTAETMQVVAMDVIALN